MIMKETQETSLKKMYLQTLSKTKEITKNNCLYKVISFGHRCSSGSIMQKLNLKTESYPFDWLVSKLDIIKDCIETKFVHFLNLNNYITKNTETVNIIDNKKTSIICNEEVQVNIYYETDIHNIYTYNFKLGLNHRNLINKNDYEYYQRCINRLYELFEKDIQKYYLYFHPIIGPNDFLNNKENILDDFDNFNEYIIKKTKNIFGIYFILIRNNENIKSIKFKETQNYNVFIIYCNDNFIDAGTPFTGDNHIEQEEILSILKNIFI
jgi:hypothetical protein